jgi:hypothetical protein
VAQPGSAPALGAGGRRFESGRPDDPDAGAHRESARARRSGPTAPAARAARRAADAGPSRAVCRATCHRGPIGRRRGGGRRGPGPRRPTRRDVQQRPAARLDGPGCEVGAAVQDPVGDSGPAGDDRYRQRRAAAGDRLLELGVGGRERCERRGVAEPEGLGQLGLPGGRPRAGVQPPGPAHAERLEPERAVERLSLAGGQHRVGAAALAAQPAGRERQRPPDAPAPVARNHPHVVDAGAPPPRVERHVPHGAAVVAHGEVRGGPVKRARFTVWEVARAVTLRGGHVVLERLVGQAPEVEGHPVRLPAPLEAAREQQRAEAAVLVERPAPDRPHPALVGISHELVEASPQALPRGGKRHRGRLAGHHELEPGDALDVPSGHGGGPPEPGPVVRGGGAKQGRPVGHARSLPAPRPRIRLAGRP